MGFRYAVLGAGRQGAAIAYDLVRNGEADEVRLADADPQIAARASERLRRLLGTAGTAIRHAPADVSRAAEVPSLLKGVHVVISAAPYRFNVELTDASIAAGCSFCDLGGNTGVVRQQLSRHEKACAAGVSVVPDCGLAPGLGNHLAAHGIGLLDQAESVHVRCGGLPQQRVGPLSYKLVFNFQGLINEYSGVAEFLRDGRRVEVPTLTELEEIEFDAPVGRCEAAVTSGGTSTCPETYQGRVTTYNYKTVRYPGHFAVIRALMELGCFEDRVRLSGGETIEPRGVMQRLFEERLAFPEVRDLVVLRVTVSGRRGGQPRTIQYDLFDRHDEATGFTAMERTTGFPTALVAHLQARGLVPPGARPLEVAVPTQTFVDELPRHDIRIRVVER